MMLRRAAPVNQAVLAAILLKPVAPAMGGRTLGTRVTAATPPTAQRIRRVEQVSRSMTRSTAAM